MLLLLAVAVLLSPNEPSTSICPCQIRSERVQQMIEDLLAVAKDQESIEGLAAPQIGIQHRIIAVNHALVGPPQFKVYINPEIVNQSEDASRKTVRAYDREGSLFVETFEGWLAPIFQREIDHLDGQE